MKRIANWFITMAVGACLSLSGCVLVHSSAIGEKSGSGSPVSAAFSDYGILHLSEPANLASATNAHLLQQCQSGQLTNVQTELSMRDWFLLVQYYTLTANATCK